jgi:hypothetical protein
MIAKIDAKISAIIDDPSSIADYKIGDKSVSRHQVLDMLGKLRERYQTLAESEPYEDIAHVALDISELGSDYSELIGDEAE